MLINNIANQFYLIYSILKFWIIMHHIIYIIFLMFVIQLTLQSLLNFQKIIQVLAINCNRKKVFKQFHPQCIMRWIVADPEICHGKPIFKGTRILVSDVLELLAAGESLETIVKEYPSLNADMIREALEYWNHPLIELTRFGQKIKKIKIFD